MDEINKYYNTDIKELDKDIEKFINKYEINNLREICNCEGLHRKINCNDCE